MKEEIIGLIKDFQIWVEKGVNLLKEYYRYDNDKPIMLAYRNKVVPRTAVINYKGLKSYYFHGIGCHFEFSDKKVDLDFGFAPNFRHDGFDSWRLWYFAQSQKNKYPHFVDMKHIEEYLQKLFNEGIIIQDLGRFGDQYYLREDVKE